MKHPVIELSIAPEQIDAICRLYGLQGPVPLTEITLGSSSLVYSLGGKYILKIDPSGAAKSNLAKEDALYKVLPKTWPCPKVIGLDESRKIIGYPYLVMSQLSGKPVDLIWKDLSTEQRVSLSQQMGDSLGKIHAMKGDAVRACFPGPVFDGHGTFEQYFQARVDRALKAIQKAKLLDQDVQSRLKQYFDKTAAHSSSGNDVSLLHGSYNFRNVLYDNKAITGIIDWEDARIGNPAVELSLVLYRYFPGRLGDEFSRAYVQRAPLPDQSPELRHPLLYYLGFLPEIPSWTKYPGRQAYFRKITRRVIKEAIG